MAIDKCFVISRNCWGEHNAKSTFFLSHLRLPIDYIPNFFQITFIMHVVQYFNCFGWLVYIYCVLGLQLGHLVLISWEIPLVIYFVLFKLFQSYLSTSLNIRWINLKKTDIIPFSYTYLITWFHTTYHPLGTNRVISQMSWRISFWESWVVNKVPIHKTLFIFIRS